MTAGRRRPAVPLHPLAAVPAATCARQLPGQPLFRGRGSTVVHALEQATPVCRVRVRRLDRWDGAPPLRLCSLCAAALAGKHLGPFWRPTRLELGELHLHAAHQLVADVRERLADIRSAAIYDGSALLGVDRLPSYRAARGMVAEPLPLPATVIVGEVLDRLAPVPVLTTLAFDVQAERQRLTDRTVTSSAGRREDLRAARKARRVR